MASNWTKAARRFWIWPVTFGIPLIAVAVWAIVSQEKEQLPAGTRGSPDRLEVAFISTPQEVVEKMLEVADVKKDDVVYDLGCGDGRIVVTAAKLYGCKAVGFDIDPQ